MQAPTEPGAMVGRPAPEGTLTGPDGAPVALRDLYRRGPLVLFFYVRNGTPG